MEINGQYFMHPVNQDEFYPRRPRQKVKPGQLKIGANGPKVVLAVQQENFALVSLAQHKRCTKLMNPCVNSRPPARLMT